MFNVKAKYVVYFVITIFAVKVVFFDLKREQGKTMNEEILSSRRTFNSNAFAPGNSKGSAPSRKKNVDQRQMRNPALINEKNSSLAEDKPSEHKPQKEIFQRREFEDFVLNWHEKAVGESEKLVALTTKLGGKENAKLITKFRQFYVYSMEQLDETLDLYRIVIDEDSKVKLFNGLIKVKVKNLDSFDMITNYFPYNIQNRFEHLNLVFIKFPFSEVKEKVEEIEQKFAPISVSYEYVERFQEN
ncbi:hypothetical protein N9N67_09155 [Bacteriovoracaceae bacterium]|nr:hypothetical protein [Bacteriovoracaceae bacterium]